MAGFWILFVLSSVTYPIHPGPHWVTPGTAQSAPEPEVYWPDERLSVNMCDPAPLQCCILNNRGGEIFWFKQQNQKVPVFVAGPFNPEGEMFDKDYQNPRFQIKKKGKCFILTISNPTLADEATYYCALLFSAKTYLQIKGTSKPAVCNNSVASGATLHGNSTNMNTQENTGSEMIRALHRTVLGLGTALGLCAFLIFGLVYYVLKTRKCENLKASIENSAGTRQKCEAETLNYAALKFPMQKVKAERRTDFSECVYAVVEKTGTLS